MNVAVRQRGETRIVDVAGQLTFESTPDLRSELLQALKQSPTALLVNLTRVSYMDSSGIATLIEGLKAAKGQKTPFGLFGLSRNTRSVLELVRLDRVFQIFSDEDEALRGLKSPPSAAPG